jgi:hypothetical protein
MEMVTGLINQGWLYQQNLAGFYFDFKIRRNGETIVYDHGEMIATSERR